MTDESYSSVSTSVEKCKPAGVHPIHFSVHWLTPTPNQKITVQPLRNLTREIFIQEKSRFFPCDGTFPILANAVFGWGVVAL